MTDAVLFALLGVIPAAWIAIRNRAWYWLAAPVVLGWVNTMIYQSFMGSLLALAFAGESTVGVRIQLYLTIIVINVGMYVAAILIERNLLRKRLLVPGSQP